MMRGIMERIHNAGKAAEGHNRDRRGIRQGRLQGRAAGHQQEGSNRSQPPRPAHRPGRSTFEKNRPMSAIYFQQTMEDESDHTIMDVPRDVKILADMVQECIEPGSTVMTDEHAGYKRLKKLGYDHHTVNRGEGEYAFGEHNEIHTNSCECRIGLLV